MANVVITGASRGIGLELCRQCLEGGDRVFAMARHPNGAAELRDLAATSSGRLTIYEMDVGNDCSVKSAALSTGSEPIDVIYNVAGSSGGERQGIDDQAWDDWHEAFNVMTIGPLRVLQAFLPRLAQGSKVMNITSQLAASTWPYGGFYAYAASKAALNRMMRSVAIDLKDRGIVIGVIHPGWVQTDMGGPDAEITPQASASGIRNVASAWTSDHSGDFLKWNGEPHPW